jgi:hypothetical protein
VAGSKKVQENLGGPKLNGKQLLCSSSIVNLLGESMITVKKDIQAPLPATDDVAHDVNIDETRHMFVCLHLNEERIHNIKLSNSSFENIIKLGYLVTKQGTKLAK